ncbi:PucR family transcriptional regulator ligand-binding domain-containing protein [Paraliobacillus ryukyuensis]|uniref:PucR family transcriptional regulator ligand-binding domain-containing protein n=1 Tax=Paraliobacillus ryukyuensis TaxID=200904 RepID=UPI00351D74CA
MCGTGSRGCVRITTISYVNNTSGRKLHKTNKIEWISVIETPVENFIRQNEFVLTTGIVCHNDHELTLPLVRPLYSSLHNCKIVL